MNDEFEEIGHSGGELVVTVSGRSYQVGYQSSSPNPVRLWAVYALPQGIPVETVQLGGIGQPWNSPPTPDCIPIFIASDKTGCFGHLCPHCGRYWRAHSAALCPYCGTRDSRHNFLTKGQLSYVQACCDLVAQAVNAGKDGQFKISMDAVADAVGRKVERPSFYYAEESQQKKFTCEACGEFNDILGSFGYCSSCGTRNDMQELEHTARSIRQRIDSGGPYEDCVRDAVAAFDSVGRQYVRQLTERVPMRPARRERLQRMKFHNLSRVAPDLKAAFEIDLLDGINSEDAAFAALMFHRRHVYEHNGGEADEKYIRDSGDNVKPKQALRETQATAHRTLGVLLRMARNLHAGFHEIFPPIPEPIEWERQKRERMSRQSG